MPVSVPADKFLSQKKCEVDDNEDLSCIETQAWPIAKDMNIILDTQFQSSWLQIQRSGFDSRCYWIFWEVVSLERGPVSLVSTIEEQLRRKSSNSGLENRDYGQRDPPRWLHNIPLSTKVGTNFSKWWSFTWYSSLDDSGHRVPPLHSLAISATGGGGMEEENSPWCLENGTADGHSIGIF
jgi:hypothetical protein